VIQDVEQHSRSAIVRGSVEKLSLIISLETSQKNACKKQSRTAKNIST